MKNKILANGVRLSSSKYAVQQIQQMIDWGIRAHQTASDTV